MVCFLISVPCFAQGDTHAKFIYTYTINNTSMTAYAQTAIPITSIRPTTDKVIGYGIQILDPSTSSESIICVYDDTDVTLIGENIGESEAPGGGASNVWYPYPRKIENGVVVNQGVNTVATIFFIRE